MVRNGQPDHVTIKIRGFQCGSARSQLLGKGACTPLRGRTFARDQFGDWIARFMECGEKMLPAAKRELLEETGIRAKKWKHAFRFFASPGFLDETMDVFLARELSMGEAQPEEDEQIEVRFFSLRKAVEMVMKNKITDAKTMTGVLWLERKLRGK